MRLARVETSVVAAAAIAVQNVGKGAVLVHAEQKRNENRQSATRENARIEYISVRSENEQDYENPKPAIGTIHSFSSLIAAAKYVVESRSRFCFIVCLRCQKLFRKMRVLLLAIQIGI